MQKYGQSICLLVEGLVTFHYQVSFALLTGCGDFLSKSSGMISSPRFPDYPYPNSIQCDWTIIVPRGKFIRLAFSTFEVEFDCNDKCWCVDRLELWDGPEFNETKIGR